MSFGFSKADKQEMELTFSGEELELVMDALRAAVPVDDPIGEKVMLRYLTKKVELQESQEKDKKRIGFV